MGKVNRCPACKRPMRRSVNQNARYWTLLHEIADGIRPNGKSFSAESWHEYFKQRFLGADEVKLPNGKVLIISKSSADLDTAEFNEYMERVEAWAAERDVYLQDLSA